MHTAASFEALKVSDDEGEPTTKASQTRLVAEFFKTPKLTLPDADKIVKEVSGDGSRDWTPQKLMEALDQHVVSQNQAKRLVAQAIRNKFRTQRIADSELRESMRPSNILV